MPELTTDQTLYELEIFEDIVADKYGWVFAVSLLILVVLLIVAIV